MLVLERHSIGWGASGRNGGQVNPGLKFDPDVVEATFGQDLGARTLALSYGAPDYAFGLIRRLSIKCDARQAGTLRAATSTISAAAVAATAADCRRRGHPVELLVEQAVRSATGSDRYACAMLDRRGGDLNPLAYVRGLALAAARAGASLHEGSPVRALRRANGAWVLETPGATVRARAVLLATNGYTDGLWPDLAQSVVPVFSSIIATEPLPEDLARAILPDRPVVYEAGRVTTYYRVDAQNRLIFGGRGPMRAIETASAMSMLKRQAERLWPALKTVRWAYGWNGRVAMTDDSWPHVHELEPGLLACLGYNGRGVALSTAMGAQLARKLANPDYEIDMPVMPPKPIRFHRLWPIGVRAVIAKARLLDSIGA